MICHLRLRLVCHKLGSISQHSLRFNEWFTFFSVKPVCYLDCATVGRILSNKVNISFSSDMPSFTLFVYGARLLFICMTS